ncbi:MAG: DNA-protecting protein DprA [Syntrophomonadaceae bacterium]|nr:DNA-protecting protein DprA [Syntrophomonadaceae bacterium]
MLRDEIPYILAVHSVTFAGSRKMRKLIDYFGGGKKIWEADASELQASLLLSGKVEELMAARRKYDPRREYENMIRRGYRATTIFDDEYPEVLKTIYNPPAVLYSRGQIEKLNHKGLAIVGARKASSYGRNVARGLARDLARAGYCIISGMARGIDTEAHRGALEADGCTVAVLGSGIDVIYPRENTGLYDRIAASGVVISEFPLHSPPESKNFPIRNRIISGLSRGVVVVEARARSGALITVDFALEQGRDVFAVPGPITSKNSEGTHNLIKQGAKLVGSAEDVLEEYQLTLRPQTITQSSSRLGKEDGQILELLGPEPIHLDQLVSGTGLKPGVLASLLLRLEMEGIIEALPGNYFIKLRDV